MSKQQQQEDYVRAHNHFLEFLTILVMLPIKTMALPLKGIVALHDSLEHQAGRPDTSEKSRPHQTKNDHRYN